MTQFDLRFVALEQLRGSPYGIQWREAYSEGWRAILQQIGIPYPIMVNARNGRVLSPPHLLIELERMRQERLDPPRGIDAANDVWRVPTILSKWDERDEQRLSLILAGGVDHTLSPGVKDDSTISILMELTRRGLERRDMSGIVSVGVSLESLGALLDELSYEPEPPRPAPALEEDTWGIPMLNLARQAEEIPRPVVKYGTLARRAGPIEGMYHFYTRDKRFRALVDDPGVIPPNCRAAVEPNFTTTKQMPAAIALYRTYQKRVISTTWQAAGLPVFVDLNVDRLFFEINLLGVPRGWRAYANRAYNRDLDHLVEAYEMACRHRGSDDVLYLVYGAGQKARTMCESRGWHWIPEDSDVKRGRYGTANLHTTG